MKTFILASGVGSRLSPLTNNLPKCLVELNGQSILERQLEALSKRGIKEIAITTGKFEDKIKEFVNTNFSELKVQYVFNPLYKKTNYIYSLWLAKGLINTDILLMHGDLVFEDSVLEGLLNFSESNAVIVDSYSRLPEKDFKGVNQNGGISKIGISFFENAIALQPMYKLSERAACEWISKINDFVTNGNVTCYAEDAFNEVSERVSLKPYDIQGKFCMEIDTIHDLEIARSKLKGIF